MATRKNVTKLSRSQRNAGDEVFDVCCGPCAQKKLNKEAAKFCASCEEYFCVSCVKNHNSFKKLSGHSLVDPDAKLSSARRSGSRFQVVPTEMCKKHHLKLVDMYCEDDDMVGCPVCMTLEHKYCVHLHYIPEYLQANSPTGQVRQTNNDLTNAIKTVTKLKTDHDNLDDNLDKSKAVCKQEIQKYRNNINEIFVTIEATTLAELDERHSHTKKTISHTHQNIQEVHREMERCKSEIESDQSNESQKFVIAKLSRYFITQAQAIETELAHCNITPLTFNRNPDIMTFLLSIITLGAIHPPETHTNQQTKQTQSTTSSAQHTHHATKPSTPTAKKITENLQQVVKKPQKANKDTTTAKQPLKQDTCIAKQPLKQDTSTAKQPLKQDTTTAKQPFKQGVYKVSDKREFSVKHPDDMETCNIRSPCILDNGDILLADYNNKNLKLIDNITYTIRSTLALDSSPWSVCRINNTQAAVGVYNIIQFVSTGDKLELLQSFKTGHTNYHVACIRDILCVGSRTAINMYTMEGKLVRTVKEDKPGHDMFSYIFGITVSDRNLVHVSDRDHGVITLNMEGDIMWTFCSGKELVEPRGLCTDEYGNVIVCGYKSDTVIQLSPAGLYMGEIVTRAQGLKNPFTVCYNRQNHQLFIIQCSPDNMVAFTLQ